MKTRIQKSKHAKAFALVVTLTLMILLSILAVGMLSLSSVSLRTSTHTSAMTEAKANARMALMIAIGELQKQMGPDQRISANADTLSLNESGTPTTVPNPNWTGVWDSWIAGEISDAPVNAIYPSAPSHHQTLGAQPDVTMRPSYQTKDRHFRAWLLSLDPEEATNIYTPLGSTLQGESMPGVDDNAVLLVGGGSVGSAAASSFVSARLIPVKEASSSDTRGRYAWWVGDESQKARVMNDSYFGETLSSADKIFRSQAPASTGNTAMAGLTGLTPAQEARLEGMPSLKTLDIVPGAQDVTDNGNTYTASQKNFHHVTPFSYTVLADVREGGLKRDLNTILERNIDPNEVYEFTYVEEFQRPTAFKTDGETFMLYNFDSMLQSVSPTGMANVPIQDLAAYYQLYDHKRSGWKEGVQYSSNDSAPSNNLLRDGIMVSTPDLGYSNNDYEKYLRQYTYQYRRPAPVKFEMALHYITEERTQAELDADPLTVDGDPTTVPDPYKLRIGLSPSMTFWNPFNVPLVMNDASTFPLGPGSHPMGKQDKSSTTWSDQPVPLTLTFKKGTSYSDPAPVTSTKSLVDINGTGFPEQMFYVNGDFPMVFEPGESKVLSLQATSLTAPGAGLSEVNLQNRGGGGGPDNEHFVPELELVPGWVPDRFVRTSNAGGRNWNNGTGESKLAAVLTFKTTDYISVDITAGAGDFGMSGISTVRQARRPYPMYHHKTFNWMPRMNASSTFFSDFLYMGFPRSGRGGIASTAPRPIRVPARQASELIIAMGDPSDFKDDIPQAFFYYGRKAATETHESRNISPPLGGAGRRFPSRPFLHSPLAQTAFFDKIDGASLYNFGWNWFFMPLDNMLDAPISISTDNFGYFGGGYTADNGTTHLVQQQLPLTPPISMAELSHALLGGHSIATEAPHYMGTWPFPDHRNMTVEGYRRATATGYGGLSPKGLQAIGNSYAHPNIPAGKAFTTVDRMYVEGTNTRTPFADHSYLANKALWDEFFFSSITPVPDNPIFDSSPRTAQEVAQEFFFAYEPLPNRRIQPYMATMNQAKHDSLFGEANLFQNGLADKIASHLLVEGAFNINSTSVEAWKALFSSLKGKPVAYYDKDTALTTGGTNLTEELPEGVPIAQGQLPNAESYQGSSSDPSDPEQWIGWRELTDTEIDQLATAMVKQVKIRGPFLSMSEFVNRRLDSANPALSVKGALQAALDDTDVSINAGFRNANRRFTAAEISYVGAVFPDAMQGAIAYGSAAYVDQADILRNMAEQLTPRGDTFIIRTYGDSLDADGNVVARAWCEAVVQRTPDYVDPTDLPYLKQSALSSESNKNFGRKINIVNFRWLSASEI